MKSWNQLKRELRREAMQELRSQLYYYALKGLSYVSERETVETTGLSRGVEVVRGQSETTTPIQEDGGTKSGRTSTQKKGSTRKAK